MSNSFDCSTQGEKSLQQLSRKLVEKLTNRLQAASNWSTEAVLSKKFLLRTYFVDVFFVDLYHELKNH